MKAHDTRQSSPKRDLSALGELTPSGSFTQLVGMWLRDLDRGAKVGPSARAPWRRFSAASECRSFTGPTTTGAVDLMPEW